MRLLQHYFTSCPSGWSGTGGLQTKRKSSEIDEHLMEILERDSRSSTYRIPYGHDAQQAEGNPKSLRFFTVSPGGYSISLAQYAGKSYDGRPGNFFIHNLLCDKKQLDEIEVNPFNLYRSGCFVKEDSSADLEIDALEIEPRTSGENDAYTFIKDHVELNRIVDILNAVFAGDRKLIIVLEDEGMRFSVIEGILLLIPCSFRYSFSFSTFESSPQSLDYNCMAILPGKNTALEFSDSEYDDQYYIFNFTESRFSSVSSKLLYSDYIAELIKNGEFDTIRKLLELFNEVDIKNDVELLDSGLNFYQDFFSSKLEYNENGCEFLKFCLNEDIQSAWLSLLTEKFSMRLDEALDDRDIKKALRILKYIFIYYRKKINEIIRSKVASSFINLFFLLVEEDNDEYLISFLEELNSLSREQTNEFWKKLTSSEMPDVLEILIRRSESNSVKQWLSAYFSNIFIILGESNDDMLIRQIDFFLGYVFESEESLSKLWKYVFSANKDFVKENPLNKVNKLLLNSIIDHSKILNRDKHKIFILENCLPNLFNLSTEDRNNIVESLFNSLNESETFEDRLLFEIILKMTARYPDYDIYFYTSFYKSPEISERIDYKEKILEYFLHSLQKKPINDQLKYRKEVLANRQYDLLNNDLFYFLIEYNNHESKLQSLVYQINNLYTFIEDEEDRSNYISSLNFLGTLPYIQPALYRNINQLIVRGKPQDLKNNIFLNHTAIQFLIDFQFEKYPEQIESVLVDLVQSSFNSPFPAIQAKAMIIKEILDIKRSPNTDTSEYSRMYLIINQLYRHKNSLSFKFRCYAIIRLIELLPNLKWDKRILESFFAVACTSCSQHEQIDFLQELLNLKVRDEIQFLSSTTEFFITRNSKNESIILIISRAQRGGKSFFREYVYNVLSIVEEIQSRIDIISAIGKSDYSITGFLPGFEYWNECVSKKNFFGAKSIKEIKIRISNIFKGAGKKKR